MVQKKAFKTSGKIGKGIIEKNVPAFIDLLKMGKDSENLKIFACSMVMDMFNMKMEDLVDIFDKQMGVAGFLNKSEGAQLLVF